MSDDSETPFTENSLSERQERFCQEYIKDLNGMHAAARAGYSEHTSAEQASRLLTKVKVKQRVQELLDQRAFRTTLTSDKILKDIETTRIRCMQGEPVFDRDGNETGQWKFEAHAALKASELQGKHLKLFTEKVEHSGSIKFDSVSDEDLDKRILELQKKTEVNE